MKAHIASAARLENVGVFLGSGCSLSAGGKMVKAIWESFKSDYTDSYAYFLTNYFITPEKDEDAAKVNIEYKFDSIDTALEDRETAKFTCSSLFLTVKETVNCIHSALKPSIHAGFQSQLIIEWE